MPDQFGQETPLEAQQRVQEMFAKQRAQFANSNLASNPYALLGQSIGNIFGGTIRKTLDTRAARKSEAARLVTETGMSVQEARDTAKQNVPRDFREVRKAKKFADASKVATNTFTQLKGVIGVERAQAAAETVMAAQLRRAGFASQATEMTMQSDARLKAEDIRELGVKSLKAELRGKIASADKTELDVAAHGEQPTGLLAMKVEDLTAKIETSTDADEIERWEYQRGVAEATIAKLTHITLSDEDGRQMTKAGFNKQMETLADLEIQDAELAALEDILNEHKGSLASTTFGRMGAWAAGRAEVWFNIDPGSYGAATLIGDVSEIDGSAAWVSAAIRHALTGAAMSPAEAVFLQPFLATPGEPISVMLGKVAAIRGFINLGIEGRRKLLEANREDPDGLGKQFIDRGLRGAQHFRPKYEGVKPKATLAEVVDLQTLISDRIAKLRKEGVQN